MIPSNPQPSTSKRKTPDEPNPMNHTTKKPRRDTSTKSGTASKRKLIGEEKPGGLVIVRVPPARPPSSQERSSETSQIHPPSSSQPSQHHHLNGDTSKPPSKKLKSDAPPHPRRTGKGKEREIPVGTRTEPEVEEDVRQMQSEADSLREKSRGADGAATTNGYGTAFSFPVGPPSRSSRLPPSHERIHDLSQPIAQQETPQIQKNKIMRGETGHRRRSSISRGKRASSSFENTGVITQPHTSVSDSTFYKHIDVDLPEPQRAQQLLIWCSHRSLTEFLEEQSSSSSSSSSRQVAKHAGKDPPPLSPDDLRVLRGAQEDLIRKLAEKKVDTSVFTPPEKLAPDKPLKDNEQNVKNRAREKRFNEHIQRLKTEQDAWSEVEKFYKSLESNTLEEVRKREAELISGKSKGKQRATVDEMQSWQLEKDLPEHFLGANGVELAKRILASDSSQKSVLSKRMEDLELTADRLLSFAHSALQTTRMTEADLDRRFTQLHLSISSRSTPLPTSFSPSTTALSSYVPVSLSRPPPTTDPQDLLRALSRVDAERPQTQVGDAARRAVREVQRVHDTIGGMSERRLTGVPPPTPRKPPGTPRRGTTPGKGR
ncbi:Mis12-Mtw1 protein family-domain-containing protein [Abortiporus biennis]|nr:Mis12-Mtw1 protein family-domain-containing protein [Abortiporus biennis]